MSNSKNSQLNLVFNVVLLIGIVVLFAMYFSDNKKSTDVVETTEQVVEPIGNQAEANVAGSTSAVNMPKDFVIAYVNTDSLWSQYEFVKDALSGLERSESQMKGQLEAAANKLKTDYEEYVRQAKAGMLSLQQQKDTEALLKKTQDDGIQMEQRMTQQLMGHQKNVNEQLTDTILSFLNNYRLENNYTLILQYGYSSGLLSANPELDVTPDVVKRLNAKYAYDKNH